LREARRRGNNTEEGVLTEYEHRLIVIRLRLVAVEYDVKEKVTMNFAKVQGKS
jgi:hypothetical protein